MDVSSNRHDASTSRTRHRQTEDINIEEQPSSKKRRRDGGRVRVTRACDLCKKCTGTQPCTLCVQAKRDCTFMSEYNRGRLPYIFVTPAGHGNPPRTANAATNRGRANPETTAHQQEVALSPTEEATALGESDPQDYQDQEDRPIRNSSSGRVRTDLADTRTISKTNLSESQALPYIRNDNERSSRNSPELSHIDQEGHYVGPASGVSFLSRALRKLHQTSHFVSTAQQTSIFNFADAPVPRYDPYFLILPSQMEAEALIRRYFDFASPTHRYLHQPAVERWCAEFYNSVRSPEPLAPGAHEKRAIILAVLAVSKQYSKDQDLSAHDTVNSTAFFAASEHHLLLESGGIRLTSIQARLVQCFYLLSQSRVNSAWSLFGTLANLILAIGLHRRRMRDTGIERDFINHECRKRVFWSAYILDSYLSVGLGRPRSFHEEDIDQICAKPEADTRRKCHYVLTTGKSRQRKYCIVRGVDKASRRHRYITQISGILRDLYGIRRLSHERQEEVMRLYDDRLIQWRDELGDFLDITKTELMMPIFRRQHSVLQLAYSHAIILLHRQALLTKSSASNIHQESANQTGSQHSVRRCLDAATTIMRKLREFTEKQEMYSAFWFTHYYVFSALVALYLYVVQNRSKPTHIWKSQLDLAQQGLSDLAACSTHTTYAQRYVVVLTELQNEAMKPNEEENRLAVLRNGSQLSCEQPCPALGNISGVDLGSQAIASVAGDGAASSREYAIPTELDVQVLQEFNHPGQYDVYDSADDPWTLQGPENREAFRNLGIEGLADLSFIFSAEENDVFHSEDGIM